MHPIPAIIRPRLLRARAAVSAAALVLACSDANDVSSIVSGANTESAATHASDATEPTEDAVPTDDTEPREPGPAQVDAMADALDISAHLPFWQVPPATEELSSR